jgi:hypothetical protein
MLIVQMIACNGRAVISSRKLSPTTYPHIGISKPDISICGHLIFMSGFVFARFPYFLSTFAG